MILLHKNRKSKREAEESCKTTTTIQLNSTHKEIATTTLSN